MTLSRSICPTPSFCKAPKPRFAGWVTRRGWHPILHGTHSTPKTSRPVCLRPPTVILTVAIGDATGHGMKAGTMVTAAKSLFGTYNESVRIPDFFNHFTKVIKGMNLGKLYMALMILQIKKDKLVLSTAGMPPALLFRKKEKTIDEIILKGPPLGAFSDYSYRTRETGIDPGDVLLLMSDGFPERFNKKGEMMGMARVKKTFRGVAERSPTQIILALEEAGEAWGGGSVQDDDITFVVIKRT